MTSKTEKLSESFRCSKSLRCTERRSEQDDDVLSCELAAQQTCSGFPLRMAGELPVALLTGRFCLFTQSQTRSACPTAGAEPACTSAAFDTTATSVCGRVQKREKSGMCACPQRRGLSPYLESPLTCLTQDKELRVPHEGQSGLQEFMPDLPFLCQE